MTDLTSRPPRRLGWRLRGRSPRVFLYCRKYWMWPIWWKMDSRSFIVTSVHFYPRVKGQGSRRMGMPWE